MEEIEINILKGTPSGDGGEQSLIRRGVLPFLRLPLCCMNLNHAETYRAHHSTI